MRRILPLVRALAVALVVVMPACTDDGGGGGGLPPPVDDDAPIPVPGGEDPFDVTDVVLETFDGGEVTLDAYAGQPVVVNFFATWCAPCVTEMPGFERVHRAAGDQIAFVGVNVQDRAEDGMRLARQTGVTWDLVRDPDGLMVRSVGGIGMPTTVLLSPEGDILERHTGELSPEELIELIAEHFGIAVSL